MAFQIHLAESPFADQCIGIACLTEHLGNRRILITKRLSLHVLACVSAYMRVPHVLPSH